MGQTFLVYLFCKYLRLVCTVIYHLLIAIDSNVQSTYLYLALTRRRRSTTLTAARLKAQLQNIFQECLEPARPEGRFI